MFEIHHSPLKAITICKRFRYFLSTICILLFFSPVSAADKRNSDSFEFVNQDLRDIVYILSLRSGKSIICDDTVSGNGSFMYVTNGSEDDFEAAFDAFLYSNKLLVIKNETLWTVTKVKVDEGENKRSVF